MLPADGSNPLALVAAGSTLYIAEHGTSVLDRMGLDGAFGRAVKLRHEPDALTTWPDGALWYASGNHGLVGRVELP